MGAVILGCLAVTAVEAANTRPRPPVNQAQQRQYQNAFRQNQYRSPLAAMQRVQQQRAQQAMMMNYMRMMGGMYGNNGLGGPGTDGSFTDYKLIPGDDVIVRRYRLLPKDPTDPKAKYTTEELKELKGSDSSLIGYTSSFDDLKVGQTIRCTQAVKRTDPKDPEKVSYVATNTITGTLNQLDGNSLKEFVVRVRGAAVGTAAYGMQQPRNNNNNNNKTNNNKTNNNKTNNNNVTTKDADPNKVVTLIVIYSDDAAVPAVAAQK